MVKLREDYSLPALVMPEFMRPGSNLYALVPPEVHEARRKAAENLSVDQQLMEERLVDFCDRGPLDPGSKYLPSTPTVRDELRRLLQIPNPPSFGSTYPFFKPPIKTLLPQVRQFFTQLENRFSFIEEVKGGSLQVIIELIDPDAPYYYVFRFRKSSPRSAAVLEFEVVYHTWRTSILLGFLATDHRDFWIYSEDDIPRMLQTGCDYINGIADFLEELDQAKT